MLGAAVLTGDLIASTKAGPEAVEQAMRTLSDAAVQVGKWAGHNTRFTRFRGDGWQIYINKPELALRSTVYLLARLRAAGPGLFTRISIAIGPYDTLGAQGLSGAAGSVFEASGRMLDKMPKTRRISYLEDSTDAPLKFAIFDLINWQASRWSREQAETVALALSPDEPTQDAVATHLGISRQAAQARLKGAGLAAIQTAIEAFEAPEWF